MYACFGLHCLVLEAATRVEVFCKRGVLKNCIIFTGNHLCWSLFLIKLQSLHLFWRTSVNDCFCSALAALAVTYPFSLYSAPSTSLSLLLLLTSPIFVFGSNSKGLKEFKSGISFLLSFFDGVIFFLHVFSVFLSFVSFFLVAANKKDL